MQRSVAEGGVDWNGTAMGVQLFCFSVVCGKQDVDAYGFHPFVLLVGGDKALSEDTGWCGLSFLS